MKPTTFKGQTTVLAKPPGMTDEECGELAILQLDDTCISCWTMNWRERLKALFTGRIWLGVLSGRTQPPVYCAVDRPFTTAQMDAIQQRELQELEFTNYLLKKYGEDAKAKMLRLNSAGIGQTDLRRNFTIEKRDLANAKNFGIAYLMGLKLCA